MSKFNFDGVDANGREIEGTVHGSSVDAAIASIRASGFFPTRVEAAEESEATHETGNVSIRHKPVARRDPTPHTESAEDTTFIESLCRPVIICVAMTYLIAVAIWRKAVAFFVTPTERFILVDNDRISGPFPKDHLRSMWDAGQITTTAMVCVEGAQDWRGIQELFIEKPAG